MTRIAENPKDEKLKEVADEFLKTVRLEKELAWQKFLHSKNTSGIYDYSLRQYLISIDELPPEYSKNNIPPYRVMSRRERKDIGRLIGKKTFKNKQREKQKDMLNDQPDRVVPVSDKTMKHIKDGKV
jgi:hypothetical protein